MCSIIKPCQWTKLKPCKPSPRNVVKTCYFVKYTNGTTLKWILWQTFASTCNGALKSLTKTSFLYSRLLARLKHLDFTLLILGVPNTTWTLLKHYKVRSGQNSRPKHNFLREFKIIEWLQNMSSSNVEHHKASQDWKIYQWCSTRCRIDASWRTVVETVRRKSNRFTWSRQ